MRSALLEYAGSQGHRVSPARPELRIADWPASLYQMAPTVPHPPEANARLDEAYIARRVHPTPSCGNGTGENPSDVEKGIEHIAAKFRWPSLGARRVDREQLAPIEHEPLPVNQCELYCVTT